MRVFLTGGTGFIGQPLTKALLARGWAVTALVRNTDGGAARVLAALGATLARGDVTDRESMRAPMTGADIVVHNAGHYELGVIGEARQRMEAINVQGTENVLELALELRVPRTVYVSSTTWTGETGPEAHDESHRRRTPHRTHYERTKSDAHHVALRLGERGLPLIIVCPNGVVGPNDHSATGYFLRLYLNRLQPPFAWAPHVVMSYVHVDDAAEGIALAAEKGCIGETYLIAGEGISRREMVQHWMQHPGGMRVRLWLPHWLARLMFAPMEPLQRLLGLPAFISRESVDGSVHLHYSGGKAKQELGWTHLPAAEMWAQIIADERRLREARTKRDLVSMLKPHEPE